MDEGVFDRAVSFADGLFAGDSGGHDIHHTLRVHALARTICSKEGGDMDVVRMSALLHDVDDRNLFGGEGMPNARSFMRGEGLPADFIEEVCLNISQVSFKGTDSTVPDTLEGRIVQDADRLDAIGAVGIGRAFAYGGSRGRDMHIPGEGPNLGMGAEEYHSNKGTTINHFHEKLLLLKDMMNTPTARSMAESRHRYMEGFLEEFLSEWDGLR